MVVSLHEHFLIHLISLFLFPFLFCPHVLSLFPHFLSLRIPSLFPSSIFSCFVHDLDDPHHLALITIPSFPTLYLRIIHCTNTVTVFCSTIMRSHVAAVHTPRYFSPSHILLLPMSLSSHPSLFSFRYVFSWD